ncbi:MAG: ATP-binding protein [Candidatus Aminicenantes bacterium]|nr:ATP-binding protein [Candidatus Aminicenantes bacterium]
MKRSIFFKYFGGYLVIIVAFSAVVLLLSFNVIRKFHIDSLSHNLVTLARSLEWKVASYIEKSEFEELDIFVKEFGKKIQTRITIVDREGIVLADSDEDPALMENHKFRPEIYQAFGGNTGQSLRFSSTVKTGMLYVGIPMEKDGEITGVLRVSLYLRDITRLLSRLRSNIIGVAGIMALLSLFGAFLFARLFLRPIRELSIASRRIASGDFKARVFLKNRDEFRELAESFNLMTEKIDFLFSELSQSQEELKGILSSLKEGLLSIGSEDQVLLYNESLAKIVQVDQLENKKFWEIIRSPAFDNLIAFVRKNKMESSDEIVINNRIYLASAQFLGQRKEVVVTLHDVTQSKEVERIKKDFIVNASHELRTPLTAIKGFVETLQEEAEGDNLNYLNIIERNTERLINIVNDLLLLSELEEREVKLEFEKINIKELITSCLKLFMTRIKDKNLDVEIIEKTNIPEIQGDAFKLEQLFINIIDNAVKYTDKGKLFISLEKEEETVRIDIQDSGIGISPEHLDRIFERFYVVDKSRSRLLGGTGLGLSIVKHIVLLHKGRISVKSTSAAGTRVTVLLPL